MDRNTGNWFALELRGIDFCWQVFTDDDREIASGVTESLDTAKAEAAPYLPEQIIDGLTEAKAAVQARYRQ